MSSARHLTGLCLLLGLNAAFAQDAPGTRVIRKEVIEQARPADEAVFDNVAFQQRYQQHGRPAIAIFWNRQVTDVLAQWQATTRTVEERTRAEQTVNGGDSTRQEQRVAATRRFEERNVGTQQGRNNAELASREQDIELGVAFTQFLLNAGVALVDRELVMRLAQRARSTDILEQTAPDYYAIEMDALADYANYVAEVLLTSASAEATQLSLRVNIQDVTSGRIIGTFLVKGDVVALDSAGNGRSVEWITGPAGYERRVEIPEPATDMTAIGTEIARQTLQVLDRYWQSNPIR